MALARRLVLLPLLAVLALTTGCLDYREHLLLEKDGSGLLKIDFVVDLGILNDISAALGEKPDPNATKGPSKEEVLQGLEVEGIKVKELDIQQKDARSKVHIVLAFKDADALSQMEGFGDDRRIDYYDEGDGKVRVVYSFDTKDQLPMEEFGEAGTKPEDMDPIEKKIVALTSAAREKIRFRSRVTLPGPILKATGVKDPREPKENERVWLIDKERDPKKHARLGKGKLRMQMIVDRETVPWVKELKPLPKYMQGKKGDEEVEGDDGPKEPKPPKKKDPKVVPKGPGGLGD
ncbi:MAG: hypothetical protein AB7N76_06400 [Planctomycetota bacterium]